ncbi:MAG: hypothetical protein LBE78_13165 [Burkholderiaceae bacterium]|nr:hypothetical protein [Burkholderiaceae bacterium]
MNVDFPRPDHLHLLGKRATHPIRLPSGALAALLVLAGGKPAASSPLQGAAQPEAVPARAVQGRAGALGAAALALASPPDDD